MTTSTSRTSKTPRTLPGAIGWLLAGWGSVCLFSQAVLEDPQLSRAFLSPLLWERVVGLLGGTPDVQNPATDLATVPLSSVAGVSAIVVFAGWLGGAAVIALAGRRKWTDALATWGSHGGKWWCPLGLWYVFWLTSTLLNLAGIAAILVASAELWWAVAVAGWLTTLLVLIRSGDAAGVSSPTPGWAWVGLSIFVYTLVWTGMNWQLYRGLLIPHGDSAMYEEHLWNVTHGKGFRSYLDQGLFLGEHLQVIHLALLPVYVLWPSHLLLELCESLSLALTALPMYWIVQRHTGSERVALWMVGGLLLYFPLHYLDIAIDLKTFRPISFGVPLLLLAIDQMERRRWATMAALLIATLTAKEDYAIVIAPLGVWLLATTWFERRHVPVSRQVQESPAPSSAGLWVGGTIAVLATAYLFLAVKVVIPWFREGGTVHYARYFSQFGRTPTEIIVSMLTQPGLVFRKLYTAATILYALRVLVPLGGVPLLSPTRLLVGAPLFVLLCLNELAQETPAPVHHFHAPLLPIVFWSAAAGLAGVPALLQRLRPAGRRPPAGSVLAAARFSCLCALTTGLVVSMHPLSRKFWDSGDAMYWRRLYVPGERAARFEEILPLIPESARVASTDFVHPRFTHYERSYDYSGYLRKVAGYQRRVPDDTDYIVIDTRHSYSTMHVPADVPEYRHPDEWELLTPDPDPWFIVLKRKRAPAE